VPFIDAFRGGGAEQAPLAIKLRLLWAATIDAFPGFLRLSPHLVPIVDRHR
jgi:hypothetical protein